MSYLIPILGIFILDKLLDECRPWINAEEEGNNDNDDDDLKIRGSELLPLDSRLLPTLEGKATKEFIISTHLFLKKAAPPPPTV